MVAQLTTASWFPVLTLILGFVAALATDYFRDKRLLAREREARADQRREAVQLRRLEFQRATLLEFQEAISKVARMTGAGHHQDVMAFRTSGVWGKQQLTEEVNEGGLQARTWFSRLQNRIADDPLRSLATKFSDACVECTLAPTDVDAENAMRVMTSALREMDERLGKVLRSLDGDENSIIGLKA